MFVIMGAVPLVIEIRASIRALFLGTTNVAGVKFEETGRERSSFLRTGSWDKSESDDRIAPTAGDWTLALGLAIVAIGLGIYLAGELYSSFGS